MRRRFNKAVAALPRAMVLTLLVFAISSSMPLSGQPPLDVTPGRVHGEIVFRDASPEVLAFLNQKPVREIAGGWWLPVALYEIGNPWQPRARAPYTAENQLPAADRYVAASYDMNPYVADTGDDLVLSVSSVIFDGGGTYRFGSPHDGVADARICSGIPPLTIDPAGTTCDIEECAALLDLTVRFAGDPADLAAIEPLPVSCRASVTNFEDPWGSGETQAESEYYLFDPQDLMSPAGVQMVLLARSSSQPVTVSMWCLASIVDGEVGFEIDPDSGLGVFDTSFELSSLACGEHWTGPGGGGPLDIPLERTAGVLEGYLDVSGHDETLAWVALDQLWSSPGTPVTPTPAGDLPSEKWRFEGVEAGWHEVIGWAAVDGGERLLLMPYLGGPNGGALVQVGQTTDLGATFVTDPAAIAGNVVVRDPGGDAGLADLHAEPLAYPYLSGNTVAAGSGVVSLPNVPNPGSAYEGLSLALLDGSFDPVEKEARLQYELLLGGLSLSTGDLDGRGSRSTLWDLDRFSLALSESSGAYSYCSMMAADDRRFLAVSGDGPLSAPEFRTCVGRLRVPIQVDPAHGTLFRPELYVTSLDWYLTTSPGETPLLSANGWSRGVPSSASDSAPVVAAAVTVPQGFRYSGTASVSFVPVGGSESDATRMEIGTFELPGQGVVGCGSVNQLCLVENPSGEGFLGLSVTVTDASGLTTPQYCLASPAIDLHVVVDSDGVDVSEVFYKLGGPDLDETACQSPSGEAQVCASCGPDPSEVISVTGLTGGEYSLVACATTAHTTCGSVYPFTVELEALALTCPADLELSVANGVTEVPYGDVADQLLAEVTGACSDVPPLPPADAWVAFPLGTTTVDFAYGTLSCSTNVTVTSPWVHDLAFGQLVAGGDLVRIYRVEDDSFRTVDLAGATHPAELWLEYARDGAKLALAGGGAAFEVRRYDAESTVFLPSAYQPSEAPTNAAFRPGHPGQLAVVSSDGASFTLELVEDATVLDSFSFPPTAQHTRPEITWSSSGDRLLAAGTAPVAGGGSILFVTGWDVPDTTLLSSGSTGLALPFEEFVHELLLLPGDSLLVGAEHGIYVNDGATLAPIHAAQMDDLDLTADGSAAVVLTIVDRTPGYVGMVFGLLDLDQTTPDIVPGPALLDGRSVAISDDQEYVAVATGDKLFVYSFPDFSLVKELVVNRPHDMVFRPLTP